MGMWDVEYNLLLKEFLEVVGEEATHKVGKYQLWGGMVSGIEWGIHTIFLVWSKHYYEE